MSATRVVRWQAGWNEGDFLGAIIKAGGLESGSLVTLDYRHDDECPKLVGGPCRCDPEVTATILLPPEAT